MGILSNLFGVSDSENADINDEINIAEAITAHVTWKVRLQKYIDGKSDEKLDPMIICRDDQCTLGQWMHGPATQRFHADEAFRTLRSDHAHFHYVAANVVRYMDERDQAGAQALLKGEYSKVSHNVIMMLLKLHQPNSK